MDGFQVLALVLSIATFAGFGPGLARRFARRRHAGAWPTIRAKVAETSVVDVRDEETRTHTRVVLLIHPPGGEQVAIDQTRPFADWQKDQLLPDAEITIRYNPADPEEFEIVWGPREPLRPTSTSMYGPRR